MLDAIATVEHPQNKIFITNPGGAIYTYLLNTYWPKGVTDIKELLLLESRRLEMEAKIRNDEAIDLRRSEEVELKFQELAKMLGPAVDAMSRAQVLEWLSEHEPIGKVYLKSGLTDLVRNEIIHRLSKAEVAT